MRKQVRFITEQGTRQYCGELSYSHSSISKAHHLQVFFLVIHDDLETYAALAEKQQDHPFDEDHLESPPSSFVDDYAEWENKEQAGVKKKTMTIPNAGFKCYMCVCMYV